MEIPPQKGGRRPLIFPFYYNGQRWFSQRFFVEDGAIIRVGAKVLNQNKKEVESIEAA